MGKNWQVMAMSPGHEKILIIAQYCSNSLVTLQTEHSVSLKLQA